MIVGKIWDSEYPWDVRVEKVCQTLTSAGHRVELACRNRRHEPILEEAGLLRIHRMPPLPDSLRRLEGVSSFPAFVNPRWHGFVRARFAETGVDVVLCRDLPLAPLALRVGRSLRRPVVIDLAEHYPGLLKDLYNRHDFRVQNLLARNPWLAHLVERQSVPRADAIWVVVDEMAERLTTLGVPADRISLVSNTPTAERLALCDPRNEPVHDGDPLRVVYHGLVERSRGLSVVVAALALLRDRLGGPPPIRFDVFGDGTGFARLRDAVDAADMGSIVTLQGRQPYEAILGRLREFDVGIIPHHATDHWNYTVQNKLFDYFSAGLPVVVSSMKPAERIVQTTGAGLVFANRDPADLARALTDIRPAGLRARMRSAGRGAAVTTYNWERDGARLLGSLARLVNDRPAPLLAGADVSS